MASFTLVLGEDREGWPDALLIDGLPFKTDSDSPVAAAIVWQKTLTAFTTIVGVGVPETKTLCLYGAEAPTTGLRRLTKEDIGPGTALTGTVVYRVDP